MPFTNPKPKKKRARSSPSGLPTRARKLRIWRSGNSAVVTLPADLLRHLKAAPGDMLHLRMALRRNLVVSKSYDKS
jgi:hypothetical protein